MTIFEIPVITDKNLKVQQVLEAVFETKVRHFEGMDFIKVELDEYLLYIYIFDYEADTYQYLWDLIIPHALGYLYIVDWLNLISFQNYLLMLDLLQKKYATPLLICSSPMPEALPKELKERGISADGDMQLHHFNAEDRESIKMIFARLFETDGI